LVGARLKGLLDQEKGKLQDNKDDAFHFLPVAKSV
jgi:hypothetical protein